VEISVPKTLKNNSVHLNKSVYITKLFETHSCSLQAEGGHKIDTGLMEPDKALAGE
jgi:hypothetical protein